MKRGLIWCLVLFLLLPGLASALSSGSSGQEVQALQQRLKDLVTTCLKPAKRTGRRWT